MGTLDLTMSDGDNVLGDDGNYETTETASGKMYRLLMTRRGRCAFIAHDPTLDFGRNYRERAKWSESDVATWIADTEDCFKPLVDAGEIKDLEVKEMPSSTRNSPRFRITATDTRTQRKVTLEPDPTPWGY